MRKHKKDTIIEEIKKAEEGKPIMIDMGDYSWTIKSDSISNVNLADINLEVRKVDDVIPSDLLHSLAGDKPVQQISLTYNGNLGFQAKLNLNVGSDHQDNCGSLYYHDPSDKMLFQNASIIGEDGFVRVNFSRASDYAIVISNMNIL